MKDSELESLSLIAQFSWNFKPKALDLVFTTITTTTIDLAMITNLYLNYYSEATMVILNLDYCCCYEAVAMEIVLILCFNEKGAFSAAVQIILIVPHRIRVISSFSLRFLRF